VIDGNSPAVQVAVATFGMYPAAQATAQGALSAIPMVALEPQIPSAWALATVGKTQPGVQVTVSKSPAAQAAVAELRK
jgi:hypothetical protein